MDFDAKRIVSLIVAQRTAIVQLLESHEKSSVLTSRIMQLCRPGSEAGIVQLALMDDCLHAIESVLFSLNGSRNIDVDAIHKFLQPVSQLYAKKDRKLYSQFGELQRRDCERFLETHYTDGGPFGGANRRTKWSGFQLANNADRLSIGNAGKTSYRAMFECAVNPLLDENESVADVLELGGLWYALQCKDELSGKVSSSDEGGGLILSGKMPEMTLADFGNQSTLFDVVSGVGCSPTVKLNSSHKAFQNGHTMELLLQAWAKMESTAWDRRKQLLEDIRSDWGRVARDLIAESREALSE